MIKYGVTDSEKRADDEPDSAQKQAEQPKEKCGQGSCTKTACGHDVVSTLAEEAAKAIKQGE